MECRICLAAGAAGKIRWPGVQKRNAPSASVESAFQAVLITQMANISLREGRRVRWDSQRMRVV